MSLSCSLAPLRVCLAFKYMHLCRESSESECRVVIITNELHLLPYLRSDFSSRIDVSCDLVGGEAPISLLLVLDGMNTAPTILYHRLFPPLAQKLGLLHKTFERRHSARDRDI